ncbi:MAG: phage tail tape measure protein [Bacteroidales bacterium]|nr:phage tail tape measure protein [Bacteroidales bacterium]
MPGAEKVRLEVELVEKNAEARLKALDKLAKEMGNRKITLNFDEASLQRWKAATDGMSAAQINAWAKIATAVEKTTQTEITAANRVQTAVVQAEAKKVQAAERTSQERIKADAKIEAAEIKASASTKRHTVAVNELGTEANKTSGIFDTLTARFTAANLVSSLVTRGMSALRQAVREANTELKAMDKELTTIKMVTGASDSYIDQLTTQAFAGAKANGRSVNDYLTAAERFSRAGYRGNIDDLSKLSLMTQNIGGVEEETAAKFLLAADAAWKLGGSYDALMEVLDGVSSVADQNATDLGKIAEGITVAGSAMANAGESAATFTAMLGVTTASTQRSGSEMARGLRMILFRVRQVKAEFEDGEIVDEDAISNAANALKNIAHINVLDEQTHDLKSMSQILSELAPKWKNLSDAEQSALQNYLAGNRNGNVLFALMDNWGTYEKMLAQYENSAGTALSKNEEYTKSWAAETDRLKSSWTELMGTITANGDLQKSFLSGLSEFVESVNSVIKWSNENDPTLKGTGGFGSISNPLQGNIEREKAQEAYSQGYMWSGYAESVKKADEELKKYTDDAGKAADATDDLTDSSGKAKTAFDKQREAISEAAKAIKEEKDDAVNSLADIYKAAIEAADKGLYGSNAYRKGGALFFSGENLDQLEKEGKLSAREYLDGYFKEIESGDYSTAAANFFGKITGGTNEIKDSNDQTIASVKDLGDSFEWTFDKGSLSMDEYLKSLSSATGISETFWASMIESLGLYSEDLAKWTETNGEIETKADIKTEEAESKATSLQKMYDKLKEDITTKVDAQTRQAQTATEALISTLNKVPRQITSTISVNVVRSGSSGNTGYSWSGYGPQSQGPRTATDYSGTSTFNKPFSANDDLWAVQEHYVPSQSTSSSGNTGYNWSGYKGRASGKRDNYSGIALVNDEFPANGSKPELIISKSKGMAYIANGGKPALVNLASDDVVLTAAETRSAFGGVPAFAVGAGSLNTMPNARESGSKSGTAVTAKTPKTSSNTSSKKSSEEKADPTDNWNQFKKLVDYMMDQEKDILDEKLAILDKQLDELEKARKQQNNIDALAQKLVKVDEAQLDVLKAQTERTVRYYNESTNQWEWMADQGALAEAEKAYSTALKDLNDFLVDLNFEEQKANIKAQKDALQEAFNTYKKGWDTIIESIEAPTGDLAALFAELKVSGTDAMKSQTQNIETLLGALEKGFYTSIDDAALANAESLAETFAMLEKSSSDSQAIAQQAIDNILGRSTKASQDITGAAQLALGDMSTISSTNVTDLMGKAQLTLNSMATDTEYTGEGMAQTLSDATVNITGAAADAIKDIVQNANDFLDRVKQAEAEKEAAAKAAEKAQTSSKSGGGGGGKSSKSKSNDVIGETKGSESGLTSLAKDIISDAKDFTVKAASSVVKNITTTAMKNNITNNNGGNTYINGVSVGSSQINAPLSKVLSNIKLQTNATR